MRINNTSTQNRTLHPQQVGFSLIEIAIVLGVVGIIVGGIWAASSSVYDSNKVKRANDQVIEIVTGMRNAYATRPMDGAQWENITGIAISAGILPKDMVVPGITTYGTTPWSGGTRLNIFAYPGAENAFIIRFNFISQTACNSLASKIIFGNTQIKYWLITGTTGFTNGGFGSNALPPTPQVIAGLCRAGDNMVDVMYSITR